MSDLDRHLEGLTEEQRRLLRVLLEQEGVGLADAIASDRRDRSDAVLSFTQERLWLSGELAPGTAFGNLPLAFRVEGPLDVAAVGRSVAEVARRHQILRTIYRAEGGAPQQHVVEAVDVPVRNEDVTERPKAERLPQALRLAREEALRPFDLVRDIPLRCLVVKLDDEDHLWLVVTHHIATDGWGIRILLRELSACYAAFAAGASPALPEASFQYKDFAVWQREHVASGALDAQRRHWAERLEGAPSQVAFPLRRRAAGHPYASGSIPFELDARLSDALRQASRQQGVTLYTTLLAAFQVLLHGVTGQSDLAVGSIISNRARRDTEGLVGNFGNNVFCRVRFADAPSFREVLLRVRDQVLDAQRNQDVPLETLIDERLAQGRQSPVPRFQVMFILRDSPLVRNLEIPGLEFEEVPIEVDLMPLDLDLDLTDGGPAIRGFLAWNRNLIERGVAARLVDAYQALLREVVEDPERPVAQLQAVRELAIRPAAGRVAEARAEAPAPQDEIERTLVLLWSEALGVPVSVRDDFFDRGGHSLVAARLFARMEQVLGVRLPLSALFEAPTVAALAARVRAERGAAGSAGAAGSERREFLVRLHAGPGSGEPALFLVGGAFGNVLNLRDVAAHVGRDRPCFALQARGLLGDAPPHADFDAMATDYLREIRAQQPRGPWLLGGFCTGGVVAIEMARRLLAEGEAVPLVVLLDAPLPEREERLTPADKWKIHRQRLRERGLAYPWQWLRGRVRWELDGRRQPRGGPFDPSDPLFERSQHVFRVTSAALERYQAAPYAGRVLLVRPPLDRRYPLGPGRAVDEDRHFLREDNGWGRSLRQLEVIEAAAAPGDHDGFILEPAAAGWADALRRRLREASG